MIGGWFMMVNGSSINDLNWSMDQSLVKNDAWLETIINEDDG